jgi:hypothetical protein
LTSRRTRRGIDSSPSTYFFVFSSGPQFERNDSCSEHWYVYHFLARRHCDNDTNYLQ